MSLGTVMRRRNDDTLTRRGFIQTGAAVLTVGSLGRRARADEAPAEKITIGICTDPHYADGKPRGSRHYRDSDDKLEVFVAEMNRAKPAFIIELGDFIDAGPSREAEMGYLKHIEEVFAGFHGPRYHVIGNHDLDTFSKKRFMAGAGMKAPHYAFDCGPFRCIVLDANFNKDLTPYGPGYPDWTQTYVPPAQQTWLREELGRTKKKAIIFIHQRLDDEKDPHGVKNGPAVRKVLEDSGKVVVVFQGHDHRGNCKTINGICYVTHRAMVEGPGLDNNSFAIATVSTCGRVEVKGYHKQRNLTI